MSLSKISLVMFLGFFALSIGGSVVVALAGEGSDCAAREKVTALLAEWKTASSEAQALTASEREQVATRINSLKDRCPVGCRVGDTATTVRDVLGTVIAIDAANAKHCPIEKGEKTGANAAACQAGKELKVARTEALTGLHQLASYVAGATTDGGCTSTKACGKKTATTVVSATATSTATAQDSEAAACKKSGSEMPGCPIRLASRLGVLKASWATAQQEAMQVPAETKKELHANFGALSKDVKAVSLIPQSVLALADGFDALEAIHAKMYEWAGANPDLMASLPPQAMQTFQLQAALLDEARDVLAGTAETMKTMSTELALAEPRRAHGH